jgi:uncharacterized protein (DUF2267 family)
MALLDDVRVTGPTSGRSPMPPRCWPGVLDGSADPVDERTFYATVAERAGLSRSEAADLARATLEAIAGQIAGAEVDRLATALPDWLEPHLPRHHGASRPQPLPDVVRQISGRTGLKEEEVQRGIGAVLSLLHESIDPTHLDHALSSLPAEYRRLTTG